ncbi:hypothetical protein ZWY2020_025229, partial [Hordeum vulgare]
DGGDAARPASGRRPGGAPAAGDGHDGICFRDQLWLNTYPLDCNLVFDYFALSFYDITCNNESSARAKSTLDMSQLTDGAAPVRDAQAEKVQPEKADPLLAYYILDGSIYQAPLFGSVFASRISRAMHHISKAFSTACSKLEKIVMADAAASESKAQKETIDLKELKRVDHILMSLQRKLPPAPPSTLPDGYVPTEQEKGPDDLLASEALPPAIDPSLIKGQQKDQDFNEIVPADQVNRLAR